MSLEFYDGAVKSWKVLEMKLAAHLDNFERSYSIANREVIAGIYDPNSNMSSDYTVRVTVGTIPEASTWAAEVIKLCKLNESGNPASTFDRRMFNRTRTWFRCLSFLKPYMQAHDSLTKETLWNLLLSEAESTGFYSVWLTLIEFYDHKNAVRFVRDSLAMGFYPGTEVSDIP